MFESTIELMVLFIGTFSGIAFAIFLKVIDYLEKKDKAEHKAEKEAAEREERQQHERRAERLINLIVDYDFARDAVAGKESTTWKEYQTRVKEIVSPTPQN